MIFPAGNDVDDGNDVNDLSLGKAFAMASAGERPMQRDHQPVPRGVGSSPAPSVNERDRRIARSLQRVLLRPHRDEALPGFQVEAFHEALLDEAAVGGDTCDAFALDGGRAALAVADASGKGLAAAERAAEVRFALRAFLREHGDPARALGCLNDFICDARRLGTDHDEGSTFATLTLVVLDGASGEASCLCAGGEPPLVLRGTSGTVEAVPVCGMALGLLLGQEYEAAAVRLMPGDAVLLATDGITEARHPATITFLGLEGLAGLAMQAHGLGRPLSSVGRSIFEGARAFAGGSFHDDACLLIAQRGAGTR
jgi:sigma-B regulation protein RsbU (phosphoserine phosphatase)